jgi:nucleotide sugar dehydrogenase
LTRIGAANAIGNLATERFEEDKMKTYGADRDAVVEGLKSGKISIAVYGLGRMGLPLAALFADSGARVTGVDIDPDVVRTINRGNCYVTGEPLLAELVSKSVKAGRLSATSNSVDAAKQADVMIIVVPMLINPGHAPELSNVKSICEKIAQGLEKGDLVIQEHDVPPRTTKELILPTLEKSGLKRGEFGVARCPLHARYGSIIQDIRGSFRKIVGGIDDASTQAAAALYSVINSTGVIALSDPTAAEALKMFASVCKDVNIALANEFAMISDELGISTTEVFGALNTPPAYVHMPAPGCGVGGHCIGVCGYGLASAVQSSTRLHALARNINTGMPGYAVERLQFALSKTGVKLEDASVLVLGVTYRGDVKDTLNSPSIPIIAVLTEKSSEVYAYDPLLRDEVRQYGAKVVNALGDVGEKLPIDAVLIACDHSEFKEINWSDLGARMRHRVVVDGRQCVNVKEMRDNGWIAYGIGR